MATTLDKVVHRVGIDTDTELTPAVVQAVRTFLQARLYAEQAENMRKAAQRSAIQIMRAAGLDGVNIDGTAVTYVDAPKRQFDAEGVFDGLAAILPAKVWDAITEEVIRAGLFDAEVRAGRVPESAINLIPKTPSEYLNVTELKSAITPAARS